MITGPRKVEDIISDYGIWVIIAEPVYL